jgi:hypothetical protein
VALVVARQVQGEGRHAMAHELAPAFGSSPFSRRSTATCASSWPRKHLQALK